jgi:tripeptidyl-peptidase-1
LEQYANYVDVEHFLQRHAETISKTGYNFTIDKVNGGGDSQNPMKSGSEAQLDVEYAMAIGFPSNITYYSVGGRGVLLNDTGMPLPEQNSSNEPYLEFLEYLLAKDDDEIPHVLSFSYADDELSVPRAYAERVCSMLGLLTARGTTIVAGSGDGGAAGAHNSSCQTYDGTPVTMAVFPASCPWVTAVGAVRNGVVPPEGARFSGGGFSQYFKRPSWQETAVEGYVKSLDGLLDGYYNAQMRATPDISAVGTEFDVTVALQRYKLDGTSASTPVLAAMLALIDEQRLNNDRKPLGWINRRLYQDRTVQDSIQDVADGTSASCDFEKDGKPGGWVSTQGWDAITGLGVPRDFPKFRDALYEEQRM